MSLRSEPPAVWQAALRLLLAGFVAIAALTRLAAAEEDNPLAGGHVHRAPPKSDSKDELPPARRATERGAERDTELNRAALDLIATSAREYVRRRDCFSCHHQTLPTWAWSGADRSQLRGAAPQYATDAALQVEFTRRDFTRRLDELLAGETEAAPGGPFTAGYALLQLAELDAPRDAVTDALVQYLESQQDRSGSWWIRPLRPPLEQSRFTATALALRGLQWYAPPSNDRANRLRRAAQWLRRATPVTTEDHVFRGWGLVWSAAPTPEWLAAARKLLEMQRPDGGWSRAGDRPSDAYSTAQVVSLLRWSERARAATQPREAASRAAARVGSDHKSEWMEPEIERRARQTLWNTAIERGQRWLRERRQQDGTWFAETDAEPVQEYFESGFPHGKSQFLSIAATCWGVIALSDEPPRALVARASAKTASDSPSPR